MKSVIKDITLAPSGHDKINWVKNFMPVMKAIDEEYSVSKPFAGKRMVMTMHLEAKTAYLALVLLLLKAVTDWLLELRPQAPLKVVSISRLLRPVVQV